MALQEYISFRESGNECLERSILEREEALPQDFLHGNPDEAQLINDVKRQKEDAGMRVQTAETVLSQTMKQLPKLAWTVRRGWCRQVGRAEEGVRGGIYELAASRTSKPDAKRRGWSD